VAFIFTKALAAYQIYSNSIHPSTTILQPPSPDSRSNFNRYHFCIYIRVYTVFILLPPFPTIPPSYWWPPEEPAPPASSLIFRRKKIKHKNKSMSCLR
jgi:hypothetical protein